MILFGHATFSCVSVVVVVAGGGGDRIGVHRTGNIWREYPMKGLLYRDDFGQLQLYDGGIG
jgi:hypothetical protein